MTYETQTPFVLNLHKASVQRREAPGSVESNNDDRLFQEMGSRAEGGKPRAVLRKRLENGASRRHYRPHVSSVSSSVTKMFVSFSCRLERPGTKGL